VGEHHRSEFVDSAPAVILAAAATRTQKIRLTSAVTVLSAADPVRVFQEFATLDLISDGRAEIIAGRGSSIEAQIGPSDMPSFQEFFDNPIDSCRRHRHGSPMCQAPRVDANDLASDVEQRPAGKSRIQGEVEPDMLIEFSTTAVSPLTADAANNPAACH
jgi:hypothetical protein